MKLVVIKSEYDMKRFKSKIFNTKCYLMPDNAARNPDRVRL